MDRDDFLRGYINNFGKGVGFRSEQEFVKDFLESMDPDNPDVYLPSNKEEYIPIRNKAFDQTIGKGFADAYDRYKVIGSGAFGTAFQDPDNPNKVFKAQLLNDKENIERAEREVEAQIKAAQKEEDRNAKRTLKAMDVLAALIKAQEANDLEEAKVTTKLLSDVLKQQGM